MSRKLRRRGHAERYVSLRYWLLQSSAWRSLPGNARALYVELARRYNGGNNGRIPYSVRQAFQDLHIGKTAAALALQVLQDRGFIVRTKKGSFSMKAVRDASEWRLTEYPDDLRPNHATKEFMSWQPAEPESNEPPKSRTRGLWRDRTGTVTRPHGYGGETVDAKKGLHGYCGETVNTEKDPSTGTVASHIQLPGTASAHEGCERSAPPGSAVTSEPPEWRQVELPFGLALPCGGPGHAGAAGSGALAGAITHVGPSRGSAGAGGTKLRGVPMRPITPHKKVSR
jgi:hypothetical protein